MVTATPSTNSSTGTVRNQGFRSVERSYTETRKGKRDRAIIAVLLGCGLRRRELADLTFDHLQSREERWAIVDLVGKGGHVRTVPMPNWVKRFLDDWLSAAKITHGKLFRCVCRSGTVWGDGMTEKVVWHVVKMYAKKLQIPKIAPHDLRRSCARFCHAAGGELALSEQILSGPSFNYRFTDGTSVLGFGMC